jgi:peptidoglycan biosynthesis protein MviN/MurJ (putative lipid II flippase)
MFHWLRELERTNLLFHVFGHTWQMVAIFAIPLLILGGYKRFSGYRYVGENLMLAGGTAVVVAMDLTGPFNSTHSGLGPLIAIICAFVSLWHIVRTVRSEHPQDYKVLTTNALVLTFSVCIAAACDSVIYSLTYRSFVPMLLDLSGFAWLMILCTAASLTVFSVDYAIALVLTHIRSGNEKQRSCGNS